MSCASRGHITKLKQSIFALRYLWVEEHLPHLPKVEGLSLATASRTEMIKKKKIIIICSLSFIAENVCSKLASLRHVWIER
jgi:hypothetical protein